MNADRWGQLTDSVRDFLDSDIRRILGGVTVDPITGYEYIFSQIREIFIMAVCGACIAFFFEVYESIYTMSSGGRKPRSAGGAESGGPEKHRKKKGFKGAPRVVLDFLFCVAAALIAARFWYISSCGRISFHEVAALIAGLLIGRSVFLFKNSKPVRALAVDYVIMLIIAYIVIS